ncbi:MAG: alpha/beta hydrolase [Bryobacteraceae bacterium]
MLKRPRGFGFVLIALFTVNSLAQTHWSDPSPHKTIFVRVEKNVQLEVLDWGGSGKPIVLLAGGGNTAHVFDDFAPKLVATNHVYGITRRGWGASGFAPSNDPERLGKDVLTVIEFLNLKKPILVGHSIAGAELSSAANLRPDLIGGLIYLEAGYSYAFDNGKGSNIMEAQKLQAPQPPPPTEMDLASFYALHRYYERVNGFPFPEAELREQKEATPDGRVGKDRNAPGGQMLMNLIMGTDAKKYSQIPVLALFIFANPHSLGAWVDQNTDPSVRKAANAYSAALDPLTERQIKAVEAGIPSAHVEIVPNAHHYVFLSNQEEVLRDINAFLSKGH